MDSAGKRFRCRVAPETPMKITFSAVAMLGPPQQPQQHPVTHSLVSVRPPTRLQNLGGPATATAAETPPTATGRVAPGLKDLYWQTTSTRRGNTGRRDITGSFHTRLGTTPEAASLKPSSLTLYGSAAQFPQYLSPAHGREVLSSSSSSPIQS